jgi:hypothetical protein
MPVRLGIGIIKISRHRSARPDFNDRQSLEQQNSREEPVAAPRLQHHPD